MSIINARLGVNAIDIIKQESKKSTVFGVPADSTYAIISITVCNTYDPTLGDAAQHDAFFDMHLVPDGKNYDTNRIETAVLNNVKLSAGETYTYDGGKIVMDQGEAIFLVASPDVGSGMTDLSATISYFKI